MKRILRMLIRSVLESEAATLAHDCVEWRTRAERAENDLAAIASLRPDSRIERREGGFAAFVVSQHGTRHAGAGRTLAEAIRASGA